MGNPVDLHLSRKRHRFLQCSHCLVVQAAKEGNQIPNLFIASFVRWHCRVSVGNDPRVFVIEQKMQLAIGGL
jgi:hypothetical protein